jgi:uncharacterized membrane protein YfcA
VTVAEAVAVFVAGMAAGGINTLVGSGTLITFPVLLSVGYAPVVANVSNTIGLVPGSVTGAIGYRRELAGQRERILRLGGASLSGAITGAIALLTLPESAFRAIVPVFIVIALVLIVLQPRLAGWLAERRTRPAGHGVGVLLSVYAAGVYGGYFGAAQGILLLAIFGLLLPDELQRSNALKNVLAGLVNLVAGIVFIVVADVAWEAVALIAPGAMIGGLLGARYGRRLSPTALRAVIVVVGVFAIVRLLAT